MIAFIGIGATKAHARRSVAQLLADNDQPPHTTEEETIEIERYGGVNSPWPGPRSAIYTITVVREE